MSSRVAPKIYHHQILKQTLQKHSSFTVLNNNDLKLKDDETPSETTPNPTSATPTSIHPGLLAATPHDPF